MSKIHFVLQGKGGVGKSLVASLIAQYCIEHGNTPMCIDTDPVNQSFGAYKALNVHQLDILVNNDVDQSTFDQLIELIYANPEQDMVIDNGASCFVPLSNYLIKNKIIDMLTRMGHQVVIHTVITGGQSMDDTMNGLNKLLIHYPDNCQFVAWLNPYWGAVEHNGKPFEELKTYTKNKEKINAIITLPVMQKDTFQRDFIDMLKAKELFNEAIENNTLQFMPRQRLSLLKDEIFDAIKVTNIL
jgi:hypothetical protein